MSWAPGDHPRDDLAAYALDGLDAADRAALEAHLATCPECQDDLAAYHETLAMTVEDEDPPPDLWDRIVDVIDAELDAEIAVREGPGPAADDEPHPDEPYADEPAADEPYAGSPGERGRPRCRRCRRRRH